MGNKIKNYSNGIIYKLCCKNPNIENIYIGSTTDIDCRKQYHINSCNNKNDFSYNNYKYKFIRENGNFENWDIIIVEKFSCDNKEQLEIRERYWYDKLKPQLNSIKPRSTIKEKNLLKNEWNKKNKNKKNEWSKKNYSNNDDRKKYINDYNKKYYEENKSTYHNLYKNNYIKNGKINCEICNCSIIKSNLKRHQQSKKCLNNKLN